MKNLKKTCDCCVKPVATHHNTHYILRSRCSFWTLKPSPLTPTYHFMTVTVLSCCRHPMEHFFQPNFCPLSPPPVRLPDQFWRRRGPIKQQPLSSGSDTRGADAYCAYGSSAKFLRRSSTTAAARQPPLGLIRSAESISNGRAAERLLRKRG